MHLQVGDNLHGIVRGNQIVLEPCSCQGKYRPWLLPEVKLPAFAAAFFPADLTVRESAKGSYEFERENAQRMTDEVLLGNLPAASAEAEKSNWAIAMLDEAVQRGILKEMK